MSSVSIIIANWNGRHWLEQCLPTLQAQTYQDFEIIVVDNGSDDGSVAWLEEKWPEVRVLALEQNLGFAQANNLGIQASASQFVVTLNNDTLVDAKWLAELVAAVSAPDIGMVASQIVMWRQPDILDSAGIEVDRAGIAWNRGWRQPAHSAASPRDVFGPTAAAALYRRAMLDEIGLFDEDFFAYYEDVDLAWRAQRAGWRCRYAPTARVLHWHSATGQKSPWQKTFLLGRNKIWTILKNYEWPSLLWALPIIALYDLPAVIYHIITTGNLAALHGRLSALRAMRRMLAKRSPGRHKASLIRPLPPWQAVMV